MEAREKADDSVSRIVSYFRRAELAHTCPKVVRWDLQRWIKKFERTVVQTLSELPHIQEALDHKITSEEF